MAAAIGIRMPVLDALGSVIVDIGGGTTDAALYLWEEWFVQKILK